MSKLQRLDSFKYRLLLVSLLLLSVFSPLSVESPLSQTIQFVLVQIALLSSILAAWKYRRIFWGVIALGVLAFSNSSLDFATEIAGIHFSALLLSTVFFGLLGCIFLVDILSSESINTDHLCGAICVYLLLGIIWTDLYAMILLADKDAISFPEAVLATEHVRGTLTYFSFVTLTTLGYGDIQPVSPVARTACWLEAVIGQIYVTVLVAHLVGLQISSRDPSKARSSNSIED